MKIKNILSVFVVLSLILLINRCSETVQPNVHPVEWMDTSSENFHGRQLLNEGLGGIEYCRTCHGENLNGGNADIACDQCHAGGLSGHPAWNAFVTSVDSLTHHGRFFYENGIDGVEYCKNCHGDDLTGGLAGYSCYQCHSGGPTGHPDSTLFMEYSSPDFHGNELIWEDDTSHCLNCHGDNLDGGVANFSCRGCHTLSLTIHTHDPGWIDISSPLFHASDYIWDIDTVLCKGCHGDNLDGGMLTINCGDCHSSQLPMHTHDPGFITYGDPLFHGNQFDWDNDLSQCFTCHGENLDGGSAQFSCRGCHAEELPVHDHTDSMNYESPQFHGTLFDWADTDLCSNCHGDNLDGGSVQSTCRTCHLQAEPIHTHDPGFNTYGDPLFHGGQYDWEVDTPFCSNCHGDNFDGGIVGFSCNSCHTEELPYHAHGASALDPFSPDYHGKLLWENGWDFDACGNCHGPNLDGGFVNVSCTASCHQEQNGLGYCANCHGDRLSGNPVPPLGIMNSDDPSDLSVGTHQIHLNSAIAIVSCSDCHVIPNDYLDDGHLGADNRAEVVITEDFNFYQLIPEYDYSTGTCSNSYCHGGFSFPKAGSSAAWVHTQDEIIGNNQPMIWNDLQSLTCTGCHGLPPEGHLNNGLPCINCHSSMVNGSLQIINPPLHINGEINRN